MTEANVKLGARYVVVLFFMVLAYKLITPKYVYSIKDVGEIAVGAIYGSVFGALTLIVRGHFETRIDK